MADTSDTPDPKPGDFDDELAHIDPDDVQIVEPSPDRAVSIQVIVSGEEALSLERIAQARGKEPGEVVAALIRDAAGRAA
jgi:hypothetical protein